MGKDYILMSNSARGVMKITTDGIARGDGITSRIADTAGQKYETIESLKGVVQLARLNDTQAAVLVSGERGIDLRTVDLP